MQQSCQYACMLNSQEIQGLAFFVSIKASACSSIIFTELFQGGASFGQIVLISGKVS
jgi:hypothetical protein